MAESSVSVCSVCLSAISPTNQSLLTFVCYKPSHHARAPRVRVKWNAERGMIERMKSQDSPLGMSFTTRSHPSIRPMPREVVLVPGRGFILCDRKRCVGEQCTYAHSKEELDAWNEHLSASLSNRKFSYEEKIGTPFQPLNLGQDTDIHQRTYTVPIGSHRTEMAYDNQYMGISPSNTAFSLSSRRNYQVYNHSSHSGHHGADAATPTWASDHHQFQSNPYQQPHYPRQEFQQSFQQSYQPQAMQHQYQPQPQHQQQQGLFDQQQHYQSSSLHTQSDSATSQPWQVQQPRSRRRLQTFHGLPESHDFNGIDFQATPSPSLLASAGQQHHHQVVGRVLSDPVIVTESAHQHYNASTVIKEDPWPSLGSPTITRMPPLGSHLGPHSAPHIPADAPSSSTYQHPNLPLQEAPPTRALPHRATQPPQLASQMMTSPLQQAPLSSLPSQHPIPSASLPRGADTDRQSMPSPSVPLRGSPVKASDVIYEILTSTNYKSKYQELLKCEESTHKSILENRCNGNHQLVLHQAGLKRPNWMTRESDFRHVRYGYISLSGDQIAYAVQAAQDKEGVTLTYDGNTVCTADILSENYSHVEEKLYIGFDRDRVTRLNHSDCPVLQGPCSFNVNVSFKLKHSYFNNLRKSLDRLRPDTIQRLTPDYHSFIAYRPNVQMSTHPMYKRYENLCSPDQLQALKTITLCPSSGPPVLIAGPFGTGKTRVLAVAVRFLFEQTTPFVRILVCTQQRVSADNFLETFLSLNVSFIDTFLVREYGFHNPHLKRYYRNVLNIQNHLARHPQPSRLLLVTTCLTAPHLATFLRRDFFTHILIDEGAQMREPEAVAPLCLAGNNTMIVVAGDHHQVGPSMLVLGSKARNNGLDKSLLERLLIHYQEMDDVTRNHRVTLVTNYRCHPDILELSGNLFYETPLKPPVDKAPPNLHPDYSTSFLFVCSSYSEEVAETHTNTNKKEAIVILNKLKELYDQWPYKEWGDRDLFNACIMSPSRSQLTVISKLIDDRKNGYFRLKSVRRLPTYDIQGREFRFLLLSTSEPTTDDGYIKNPTKSFCDRFVFNTAITRAQSLIVSVGNPFLLLEVEKLMIMRYGEKGKCWSTYLDFCLRNKTVSFDTSLELSRTKQKKILSKLREIVKDRQSRDFTKQPLTPSTNNDVFSSADEFPPLQRLAGPPTSLPLTREQSRPQPTPHQQQPSQVHIHASSLQQSPGVPRPLKNSPQQVQLRPEQVKTQQAKQVPWSTQQRNIPPGSPKTAQLRTRGAPTAGTQQVRPRALSGEESHPPISQPHPSGLLQQGRPGGGQQTRPSGMQQTRPGNVQQTRPQTTRQVAGGPAHSKPSRQAQAYSTLAGKKSAARPSKLPWGNDNSGLAPGALESPAEFPPLGAMSKGKKQRDGGSRGGGVRPAKVEQKERQVPSNSIRDLSLKQTERKKEISATEEDDLSRENEMDVQESEDDLASGSKVERKQDITTKSTQPAHRFELDFDVKEVLGQGGFGVVFHVKSKFDQGEYALKLTRLPNDNDKRLKVMREVHALAKLVQESHSHIVRYNTSWEEKAPRDWKSREHWSLLESSKTITASSSVPVTRPTPVADSSSHTSPSSAATPSDSTVQSVGAMTADKSDSFIEFREDSQMSSNEKDDKVARPANADSSDDVFVSNAKAGSELSALPVMKPPMVLMIQTELCKKDTLKDWLLHHINDRDKSTVFSFFQQILDALCFIHKPREGMLFVHRDLKPSNIFFARGKDNFLKIGDFGLVKGTDVMDYSVQNQSKELSSRWQQSPSMNAQGYCVGTYLYMSPEQKQGKTCDQKADIYALGMIFFELNCPFRTESERYKVLVQLSEDCYNLPKGFRDKLPNEVTTILQLLMHRDPQKRPSADTIKSDKHGELRRLKKKVGKKSKPSLIPVL